MNQQSATFPIAEHKPTSQDESRRGRTYRFHFFRGVEAARTEMLTRNHSPMDVAGARTCVDIPWELRPSLA
jgi:hypothetical protein